MADTKIGGAYFEIGARLDQLKKDLASATGMVDSAVKKEKKISVREKRVIENLEAPLKVTEQSLSDFANQIGQSLSKGFSLSGGMFSPATRALGTVAGIAGGTAIIKESLDASRELGEAQERLAINAGQVGVSYRQASEFVSGLRDRVKEVTATTETEITGVAALGFQYGLTQQQIEKFVMASIGNAKRVGQSWTDAFEALAKLRLYGGDMTKFGVFTAPGTPTQNVIDQFMRRGEAAIPALKESVELNVNKQKQLESKGKEALAGIGSKLLSFVGSIQEGLQNRLEQHEERKFTAPQLRSRGVRGAIDDALMFPGELYSAATGLFAPGRTSEDDRIRLDRTTAAMRAGNDSLGVSAKEFSVSGGQPERVPFDDNAIPKTQSGIDPVVAAVKEMKTEVVNAIKTQQQQEFTPNGSRRPYF